MRLLSIFLWIITFSSYGQSDWLYKIGSCQLGEPSGYIDSRGDTVIRLGKYHHCYSDTLKNYAIVLTKDGKCIGINNKEKELFQVYWFDNGPDYTSEGLFRIRRGDKVGFANTNGEIVIEPIYECAHPFKNGRSRVSLECSFIEVGEHLKMEGANWLFIDKKGNRIQE